jgi:hypothetical protein
METKTQRKPIEALDSASVSASVSRDELREKLRGKIQSKRGNRVKTVSSVDKVLANNPTGVDLSFAKKLVQNLGKDDLQAAIHMAASKVGGGVGVGSSRKVRKQIEKMLSEN